MQKIINPDGAQVYHFLKGIPVMIYGHKLAGELVIETGYKRQYRDQSFVEYRPKTPADTLEEVFVLEEDLG